MSSSGVFSGNGEENACVGEASVVVSVIGEQEVCVGEEDACKDKASAVVSGNGKYAVKRTSTAEYPFVRRLRERRLLSFLLSQGFHGTFESLTHETTVLFSVQHMRRLVQQGRWEDALMYLNTYLPPVADNHRRSRRARIFHTFLLMHYRFAKVLAGHKEKCLDKQYAPHRWSSTPAELRFRTITYSILASEPHQLRASYDWDKVRGHASFLVYIMAHTTPELRRSMPLPSSYMMPQQVLPIGSGLHGRRRHHVVKKQGPKQQNTDAIFLALKSRSSLRRDPGVETPNDAMELLVDYLDQSLQAGLHTGPNLSYAPQPSVQEGIPDDTCVQTMLISSTDNAKGHATSSVKISGAPFPQTISGTLKVHSMNLGISSVTNAGIPDGTCVQTMLSSSTDNAKGHATSSVKISDTPFSQTISGTLEVHSKNLGISSVTNAGKNKRLIQAGSHTENPSEGPTTVGVDIYPKKQRTTGAFGEASSVSVFGGVGGCASTDTLLNVMPKLSRACSL